MPDTYAVITPDGALTWYPLSRQAEVEAIIGRRFAGALDTSTLDPRRSLARKILASDVSAVFPEDFPVNPVAQGAVIALSAGYRTQRWCGAIALVEYETDPVTGEVLWPGEMSAEWAAAVTAAVTAAQEAGHG